MYRSIFAISALVASIFLGVTSAASSCSNDPVAKFGLDPLGIIGYWNYTAKEHKVTSADGYIIHMVRITGKEGVTSNCTNKRPVIVQHGLLCTSTDWLVMNAPKNSSDSGALVFMLVDAGFDVWMPSARGSALSRTHKTLKPTDPKYWQFSFNEMGKYDVPAMINYVLNETKQEKVSWVGHSQGTAMFFIANHYHPELKDKVDMMAALAPAAYIEDSYSPLVLALSALPQQIVEAAFIATSHGGLLPADLVKLTNTYGAKFCSAMGYLTAEVCENALFAIAGYPKYDDDSDVNDCSVQRIVSHTPSTTSVRCLTHYVQTKQTKEFKPQGNNIDNTNVVTATALGKIFDPITNSIDKLLSLIVQANQQMPLGRKKRGLLGNSIGSLVDVISEPLPNVWDLDFGELTPSRPEYNLTATQVPVKVFCGDEDSLVVTKNCHQTANKLGNLVDIIDIANFNHLDLTYHKDAAELVNRPVVDFLKGGKSQCA